MRQWLEKLSWKMERFMRGRNGQDTLNNFMLILSLILVLCASIFRFVWLDIPALALLGYATFRMYSKNLTKRRAENNAFLKLTAPVRAFFDVSRRRLEDRKTHRYFRCQKCGQYLRVPKGKGKIMITCNKCGARFARKT